jgi:hypothetical protein
METEERGVTDVEVPDLSALRQLHNERTPAVPCLRAAGVRPVVPDPCDADGADLRMIGLGLASLDGLGAAANNGQSQPPPPTEPLSRSPSPPPPRGGGGGNQITNIALSNV